jgi:acyl carrier protein
MSEVVVPPRPDSREAFTRALIDFISGPLCARHARLSQPVNIDAFTPLFETGIVDSLGIIDLLDFVESTTGAPVPMRKIDMQFFGTVDRITRSFWKPREVAR